MSTVLVRNTSEEKLPEVVEEIFDRFKVDLRAKKVLIKPNTIGPFKPKRAATTHPSVIRAILDKVLTQTEDVSVGDCPMFQDPARLKETIRETGILEAAGKYYRDLGNDAELVSIGSDPVDEVLLTGQIKEVDYIINVPKFKTHLLTGVSGCVKNVFGLMPGLAKSKMHFRLQHPKMITQFLVDLYKFVAPDLHIVDALVGMEGDGPSHGYPRRVGKIIAGTNGVEVDGVIAVMMGFAYPSRLKILELANRQGLGAVDLTRINITGDFEVLPDFRLPLTYTAAKVELVIDEDICIQCGTCEEVCQANAMKLDPFPTIDKERCISCFCCAEGCPEGALKYRGSD